MRFWSSPAQTVYIPKVSVVDPALPTLPSNVQSLSNQFVAAARERSTYYRHSHLLTPYGCDFTHQNAYESVVSMEKIMEFINLNSTYNVTVKWSTLADYIHSVNALNLSWTLQQPDFFGYVDRPHGVFFGENNKMKPLSD